VYFLCLLKRERGLRKQCLKSELVHAMIYILYNTHVHIHTHTHTHTHIHTHTHTHTHTHAVVKAVSAINAAVDGGDPESTLEALKAPPASIRSITEECAQTYQEKLLQARQEKMEAGRFGEGS